MIVRKIKKKIRKILGIDHPKSAWTKYRLNQEIRKYGFDIGDHTYGAPKILYGTANSPLKIGKYCSIGEGVKIYLGGNHNTKRVTTYPFGTFKKVWNLPKEINEIALTKGATIIGNDVWLADGATIMSGVNISDGAVVATNAVVTKDVPPYAVVAGNPARIVKSRFPDEIVAELLKTEWWNLDDKIVKDLIPHLLNENIEEFIAECKKLV